MTLCSMRFTLCHHHKKRTPIPGGPFLFSRPVEFDQTTSAKTCRGEPAGSLTLNKKFSLGFSGSWR